MTLKAYSFLHLNLAYSAIGKERPPEVVEKCYWPLHGEIELDEYLDYVSSHQGKTVRAFPIYGNDVEVFDFRPGRYMAEAPLESESEWAKLESLNLALRDTSGIEFVSPSQVLGLLDADGAGNALRLETTECPVPTATP